MSLSQPSAPALLHHLQVIRLRQKLSGAADAVKGLFGVGKGNDEVVEKLQKMQVGALMQHRQHLVLLAVSAAENTRWQLYNPVHKCS